jgi:hypothetical protein
MTRKTATGGATEILCVLLGASNMARGYGALTSYMRKQVSPIRFLNAFGPGRGYAVSGGVLNVTYPPIKDSGVFAAAHIPNSRCVLALVTDIGNDIMYGVAVDAIIAALQAVFERLQMLGARIFVTPIPQHLEADIGEAMFLLLRLLSYPRSRVQRGDVLAAIRTINAFLRESASDRITLITGLGLYCGVDRIHYDVFTGHEAWRRVAQTMLADLGFPCTRPLRSLAMLRSLASHSKHFFLSDMASVLPKDPDFF